jgi:pilus assembly protein Flp/PilA
MTCINKLVRDESAASMAEYALLLALIAIACIVGIQVMGGEINASFKQSRRKFRNASR